MKVYYILYHLLGFYIVRCFTFHENDNSLRVFLFPLWCERVGGTYPSESDRKV